MSIYLYEYSNRNTDVYFMRDGDTFIIRVQKYIAPGNWNCRIYSSRNYDNALEMLEAVLTVARGGRPAKKCAFAGSFDKCDCRAANCPDRLGGVAYWQIFHRACPYRKTR